MTCSPRYYAAACQLVMLNPASRDDISPRVKRLLDMIDLAALRAERKRRVATRCWHTVS